MSNKELTISLGDHDVAVREKGTRHIRTAKILGREIDNDGGEHVWLDRTVIAPHEAHRLTGEWSARGAVSTVLYRKAPEIPLTP